MNGIRRILLTSTLLVSPTLAAAQVPDTPEEPAAPTEPVVVSAAEAEKAEKLFEEGRKLFFQGEYLEAIEMLADAVDIDTAKTSYKLLLAKAHRYAKQEGKAIEVLEEILKANSDHVDAGTELAALLSPQKQPDRVIAVLQPLLKFKHDYPIYHLLAEAHYQKEQFDEARRYFEEATKLNPHSTDDHYQLGNIYLAQKRFAKAAAAYEESGRLGMSSGVYHFKLASVYFNLHNYLGKVTTAEVIGGKAGDIKNNLYLIDAVPAKKDVYYVAGLRSAIFQTAKARQMGVEVFDLKFLEANTWLSARRYAKAEPIFAAIQEDVRDEDLGLFWYYRARTALGLQDFDNYLERLNKAIEAEPEVYESTLSDAYVTVANRYHQRGESGRYIEYLAKAVNTNPLSASLHLSLGDAYWLASTAESAIQQYELVLELEPDHGQRVRLLNRIRGQETVSP